LKKKKRERESLTLVLPFPSIISLTTFSITHENLKKPFPTIYYAPSTASSSYLFPNPNLANPLRKKRKTKKKRKKNKPPIETQKNHFAWLYIFLMFVCHPQYVSFRQWQSSNDLRVIILCLNAC
jgi:hypothetical protein